MSFLKLKTTVKSVLDATTSALDVITDSLHSCGESELKAIEALEEIAYQLSQTLILISKDNES